MPTMILWKRLFMEAQDFNADNNILYKDNKSKILLEENGKIFQARGLKQLTVVISL